MRYFKTAEGKILCTFLRCAWMRHEVVYRGKHSILGEVIACSPSPEIPSKRDHGQLVEISEAEALEADPGLFKDGFQDCEEMKGMEPQPALAKKRKMIRERAPMQEVLF